MRQKLLNLAQLLSRNNSASAALEVLKLAASDLYLYSYVPTKAKKLIQEYGLASSEYIKNTPELLQQIYPNSKDQKTWLAKFDPKDMTLKGPSVWFSEPDLNQILKLDPTHPLSQDDYSLVRINYSKLKQDQPETKIFGLELIPYQDQDYEQNKSQIEHQLSDSEIETLSHLNFQDTWKNYLPGQGYFSPNVPHGVVLTKQKYIPSQYLEFMT